MLSRLRSLPRWRARESASSYAPSALMSERSPAPSGDGLRFMTSVSARALLIMAGSCRRRALMNQLEIWSVQWCFVSNGFCRHVGLCVHRGQNILICKPVWRINSCFSSSVGYGCWRCETNQVRSLSVVSLGRLPRRLRCLASFMTPNSPYRESPCGEP